MSRVTNAFHGVKGLRNKVKSKSAVKHTRNIRLSHPLCVRAHACTPAFTLLESHLLLEACVYVCTSYIAIYIYVWFNHLFFFLRSAFFLKVVPILRRVLLMGISFLEFRIVETKIKRIICNEQRRNLDIEIYLLRCKNIEKIKIYLGDRKLGERDFKILRYDTCYNILS